MLQNTGGFHMSLDEKIFFIPLSSKKTGFFEKKKDNRSFLFPNVSYSC
jgi:hypothetical protein